MTQTIEIANGLVIIGDNLADLKHMQVLSSTFSYRIAKLVLWINAKEIVILKNSDNLTVTDETEAH